MCKEPCFESCPDCRVGLASVSPISTEAGNEQGADATFGSTEAMLAHLDSLGEAESITAGARRDAYGPPAENHSRTATLWSAYLHARGYPRALSVEDVAWMNCLQKISRDMHAPNPDTLTDVIGYVLNIQEMRAELYAARAPGALSQP